MKMKLLFLDNLLQFYLLLGGVFILINFLAFFLVKLILPWQTKRLLKKWQIELKQKKQLPLLAALTDLVVNLTGTLTRGKPVYKDIIPMGISATKLLTIAASVEAHCQHTIAEAICDEAELRQLPLEDAAAVNYEVGRGIEALINRQAVRLGTASFLEEHGVKVDANTFTQADQLASKGLTVIFAAIGNYCRGYILLEDKPKVNVMGSVAFLKECGINCTLLTSVVRSTARHMAKAANIQNVRGGQSNMEKAREILVMQSQGSIVGAIGTSMKCDALFWAADLSIAMEYSSDEAKDFCDIIVHNGNISTLATAAEICRLSHSKKKTAILSLVIFNVLLAVATIFLFSQPVLPFISPVIPVLLGFCAIVILLMNQFSFSY